MMGWLLVWLACSGESSRVAETTPKSLPSLLTATGCTGEMATGTTADVVDVRATGGPDSWSVSVTVSSPDEDCDQYADWWEIVSPDGALVYRRILNHSHADEQPFTRASEGDVVLSADAVVWVRAHLHPTGYGGQVMEGRLGGTFAPVDVPDGFGASLAIEEPLPLDCLF